ncbi:MAG TPA: SMC-Scp complex subunit ScpB [Firmicutes bacterium]|nr:SMC-Scp complex subunit ScpB [Bacillota bacterium]
MDNSEIKRAIEAILFAAGDPVLVKHVAQALNISQETAVKAADELAAEYLQSKRGMVIKRLNDSYQMCSSKEMAEYVRSALDIKKNTPLSQAAMEVLAVIAYNQPVTRSYIEQVRGVDCSGVISSLTAKGLIEEQGRLDLPGRPLMYGTTDNFLRCFDISSLSELPRSEENISSQQMEWELKD